MSVSASKLPFVVLRIYSMWLLLCLCAFFLLCSMDIVAVVVYSGGSSQIERITGTKLFSLKGLAC